MICLGYLSSATAVMDPHSLDALIAHAQRKNATYAVTGLLCHYDGSFLQFLEGEEAAVSAIFAAISQDPRHRSLLEIYRDPISERIFGDWTMAAVALGDVGPAQRAFATNLRQVELKGAASHRQALQPFLDIFRAWVR